MGAILATQAQRCRRRSRQRELNVIGNDRPCRLVEAGSDPAWHSDAGRSSPSNVALIPVVEKGATKLGLRLSMVEGLEVEGLARGVLLAQ